MKRQIISKLILVMGCLDTTAAVHHALRGQDRHKNYKNVIGNVSAGLVDICIPLGRRKGRQTFTIPDVEADWFLKSTRWSRGASIGACEKETRELSRWQLGVTPYCCRLHRHSHSTVYAPRVARGWLLDRGAQEGACDGNTGQDFEMELRQLTYGGTVVGHKWEATHIWDESTGRLEATIPGRSPITLTFEDSKVRVHGSSGCNRCFGSVSLFTTDKVQIDMLATTRMMCHPRDVMTQEHKFTTLMAGEPFLYEVVNGGQTLEFYDIMVAPDGSESRGNLIAVFIKVAE
jgi:heat shock protein HslJ